MLKPPDRLLKLIDAKRTWVEMTLPTSNDVGYYAYVLRMVFAAIEEFFQIGSDQRRLNTRFIGEIVLEALMNAAEHGNQKNVNKKITLGFWLGENGVLFGIRDEGNFFKKPSTKKLIKSRTGFPRKDFRGFGMRVIHSGDEVYVSTEENVLYVVILADSMIIRRCNG